MADSEIFRTPTQMVQQTRVLESGTRALAKKAAADNTVGERLNNTSRELRRQVEENVPGMVNALTQLRDELTAEGSFSSTRATGTRGELKDGYRSTKAKLTLVVIGDNSPSMDEALNLAAWARGSQHNKKIDGEDKIYSLVGGVSAQMATGVNGPFDSEYIQFSLPNRDNNGRDLTAEHGDVPGKADTSVSGNIAKVIKPRSFEFSEQDQQGIYVLLRDQSYRGNGTYMAPSLQLLQDELQSDPEWKQAVAKKEEAVIVMMVTDGEIHDVPQTQQVARQLEQQGAYIMSVVLGGSSEGKRCMDAVTGQHTILADSPAELVQGLQRQADMSQGTRGRRTGV